MMKKYMIERDNKFFSSFGNELLEIDDISYDSILDELINTLDGTKS